MGGLKRKMYPKEIFKRIIEEQSQIVGKKLAYNRALATGSIRLPSNNIDGLELLSDPVKTLEKLITSYGEIFGQSSIDVCMDVIKSLPYDEISQYLPSSVKQLVQPNESSK